MKILCAGYCQDTGTMGVHNERNPTLFVIGETEDECKEKLVRAHLGFFGEDWRGEFQKWERNWNDWHFAQNVIE